MPRCSSNYMRASNYVIMDTTATSLTGTQDTSSTLDHVLLNMHGVAAETADSFRTPGTMWAIRCSQIWKSGPVMFC